MHVIVVRHGGDAVRRARPRAACRRRSCRRAWPRACPRDRRASIAVAIGLAHRQHFAELVVRNAGRQRRAARGHVFDAAQADVEVAALRGLIERGERDLHELRRPSQLAARSARRSRRRSRPASCGSRGIGFDERRAALGVAAPAQHGGACADASAAISRRDGDDCGKQDALRTAGHGVRSVYGVVFCRCEGPSRRHRRCHAASGRPGDQHRPPAAAPAVSRSRGLHEATTIFPSITPAATSSIITGQLSGRARHRRGILVRRRPEKSPTMATISGSSRARASGASRGLSRRAERRSPARAALFRRGRARRSERSLPQLPGVQRRLRARGPHPVPLLALPGAPLTET